MFPDLTLPLTPTPTADGSYTFFSAEFGEAFHSVQGARQEAELKFVQPTQLAVQAQRSQLTLLDICYGLGYNTAAALTAIWTINPTCRVTLVGLEWDRRVPETAIAQNLLRDWPPAVVNCLTTLAHQHHCETPTLDAQLLLDDARQTIQVLFRKQFQADAIFLDPFSPPHCPQLWTVDFLALVARCLAPHGYLATYSCAAAVRSALQQAGLQIGNTSPVGRRTPGTIACWQRHLLPEAAALTVQDQEHLQTRAAMPYRDPTLEDTAPTILERRQQEQATSKLESTSRWRKRWMTP